jgi:hypothetical protein
MTAPMNRAYAINATRQRARPNASAASVEHADDPPPCIEWVQGRGHRKSGSAQMETDR